VLERSATCPLNYPETLFTGSLNIAKLCRMGDRRFSNGWAAWSLVLSAALPTAVVARMGWLALSGAWDAVLNSNPQATGLALISDRWATFWWSSPAITTLLLIELPPLLLLAGVTITGHPGSLVPKGAARSAATTIGIFATLLGVVGISGFAAQFGGLLSVRTWGSAVPSQLDAFTPFIAVTLTYTLLCFTATAVLWPEKNKQLPERSTVDSTVNAANGPIRGEEGTTHPSPIGEDHVFLDSPQLKTPPAFPTPLAKDLDLYRR